MRLSKAFLAPVFCLAFTVLVSCWIVPEGALLPWPGLEEEATRPSGAMAEAARANQPGPVTLNIAGAASLQPALDELKATFEATHGAQVFLHIASTGTLRQQVEWGAPIDLLIAVSGEAIADLIRRELVVQVKEAVATNRLVLVRPTGRAWPSAWDDLGQSRGRRVAIGDPAHVPLGWFSKLALHGEGLWDELLPSLILGNDARQVVAYVQRAVVDAAIVYESDLTVQGLERVSQVPESLYPPIRYSALVVKRPRSQEQEQALHAFGEFLSSAEAQAILAAHGLGGGR